MSNEINTEQILQAIAELSEEIKGVSRKIDNVEERLNEKIDNVEERLNEKIDNVEEKLNGNITKNAGKIDKFEAKFSILSETLLDTQAEVKQLKDAK